MHRRCKIFSHYQSITVCHVIKNVRSSLYYLKSHSYHDLWLVVSVKKPLHRWCTIIKLFLGIDVTLLHFLLQLILIQLISISISIIYLKKLTRVVTRGERSFIRSKLFSRLFHFFFLNVLCTRELPVSLTVCCIIIVTGHGSCIFPGRYELIKLMLPCA